MACIDDIKTWMLANSLKLNDSKSEFILCGSKQQLAKFNIPSIRIGHCHIYPSNKCRNLGITFDSHMSHVNQIEAV